MEIVETSIYTQEIIKLLTDEEYQDLQKFLVEHPKSGDIIPKSKGLRKLRWKLRNKGKRGGIRNINYYYEEQHSIYMIYVYDKSETEDLTSKQLEILRKTFLGE